MEPTHHQSGGLIGPYEILDLLGSGGMGVVYKARDRRLGRNVAVKVLLPEVVADEAALARFEREVRAVAALSHPNILAIYDFQRDGASVYAVMELLTGGTLRDRLKSGPLPPRKAVDISIQIARGLASAHEQGFVHRDLKPENIAFTRDGGVKILDFGLARQALRVETNADTPTRAQHTLPGLILGTVGYMSPEQVRGQDVDHRSDLFAFGAVLYEMITGRRAFDRQTAADTMSAILNEDVKDFSESGVSVPPALDRVVRRCMEKHPGERFHSAGDLAFALENATGSGWHSADLPRDSGSRWSRAGRAAVLVGAGVVVGAAIAALVGPAATTGAAADPVKREQLTHSNLDSSPSASRDGTSVAFASTRRDGVSRIYTRTLADGAERQLTDGSDRRPRYFANEQSILYLRRNGRTDAAWKYSLDSGASTQILAQVSEATPSPDGQRIGFIRFEATGTEGEGERPVSVIGIAASNGTGEQRLVDQIDAEFSSLDWSADGKYLAAVRRELVSPSRTAVVVVDAASGDARAFAARDGTGYGALAWLDDRRLLVTESTTTQVYVPGAPGRVLLMDTFAGSDSTLFWQNGLFSLFGLLDSNARLDVVADGRLVFDTVNIGQTLAEHDLGPSVGPGRPLTRGASLDRQPTYSPGGDYVVFTSNRSTNLDLWLVTSDGAEYQLTADTAQDWDPGFGPDGDLVWSSNTTGNLEIWTARLEAVENGRLALVNKRQVSHDGIDAQNPTVTQDGWVIYKGGKSGEQGLWKVRLDGADAALLFPGALLGLPEVSPDGRYVLVRDDDRAHLTATIRIIEVATGSVEPHAIAIPYTLDETNADITRGRARWRSNDVIMFIGQDDDGSVGIFEQPFTPGKVNSTPAKLVVSSTPGRLTESFDISPDGKRLVVSFGNYTRNIMIAESVPGIAPERSGGR